MWVFSLYRSSRRSAGMQLEYEVNRVADSLCIQWPGGKRYSCCEHRPFRAGWCAVFLELGSLRYPPQTAASLENHRQLSSSGWVSFFFMPCLESVHPTSHLRATDERAPPHIIIEQRNEASLDFGSSISMQEIGRVHTVLVF